MFERRIDAQVLSFRMENGEIIDDATGSRWSVDGRAVAGPLAGTRLPAVQSRASFWFAFVAAFPDTDVFATQG